MVSSLRWPGQLYFSAFGSLQNTPQAKSIALLVQWSVIVFAKPESVGSIPDQEHGFLHPGVIYLNYVWF